MSTTDDAEDLFRNSAALIDQQQYDEAVRILTEAIRLAPDRSVYYYQRHVALRFLQRNDQALSDINHAISLAPREAGLYIARAYAHSYLGNHTLAFADVQVACELAPASSDVLCDAARIHAQAGEYEKAIALFDRAVVAAQHSTGFFVTRTVVKHKLAWILYHRGQIHYQHVHMITEQVQRPRFLKIRRLAKTDLATAVAMGLPAEAKQDAIAKLSALEATA